jgi:hypothetical protein
VADPPEVLLRGRLRGSGEGGDRHVGESGGPGNVPAVPEVAVYRAVAGRAAEVRLGGVVLVDVVGQDGDGGRGELGQDRDRWLPKGSVVPRTH